jgi:hypothetical protein
MNINRMIELKKELTIQLNSILTPIILEGLNEIYQVAKSTSQSNNILKTFQSLLKLIVKWSPETLLKEVGRIQSKTATSAPYLVQLIQAIFRQNMIILGIEPTNAMKRDLSFSLFIKYCYIECARECWMDPFLFYHDYSAIECKRNYLELIKLINRATDNAIRRLLPMSEILEKFLDVKGTDIMNIDSKDLYNIPLLLDIQPLVEKPVEKVVEKVIEKVAEKPVEVRQNGGSDINQKILEILNNNDIGLSESNKKNYAAAIGTNTNDENAKSFIAAKNSPKSSDILKKIIRESINANTATNRTQSIDSNIKKNVLKGLDSESVVYKPEENASNYQDVFSNSEVKRDTVFTADKQEKKSKDKFFNNYLNI